MYGTLEVLFNETLVGIVGVCSVSQFLVYIYFKFVQHDIQKRKENEAVKVLMEQRKYLETTREFLNDVYTKIEALEKKIAEIKSNEEREST